MKLGETVQLDFVTHDPTTGAVTDADSLPTAEVFEDAVDTTVASLSVTKRTSKTGNYRVAVVATTGLGFEVGKSYNVIASASVGGIIGKAVIGRFRVTARELDDLAYPAVSGRSLNVDATGTTAADVLEWLGSSPTGLSSGKVMATATVTGYLSGQDMYPHRGVLADDAIGDTAELDPTATDQGQIYVGMLIVILSGTDAGQARLIIAYDGPTRMATVFPDWATGSVAGSSKYAIVPFGYIPGVLGPLLGDVDGKILGNTYDISGPQQIGVAITAQGILRVEPRKFYFVLYDSSGAPKTGVTVTAERAFDGATSFSAATGTVTEVANGGYVFAAADADLNCDDFLFRFSGSGAVDAFIAGNTVKTGA